MDSDKHTVHTKQVIGNNWASGPEITQIFLLTVSWLLETPLQLLLTDLGLEFLQYTDASRSPAKQYGAFSLPHT